MILEVHHLVSVPSSSHGAAQARLQCFFFHSAKFNDQRFLVKKKGMSESKISVMPDKLSS